MKYVVVYVVIMRGVL